MIPAAVPGAADLPARIRTGGVIAGLLATFIPGIIALALQWSEAGARDRLSVIIPAAIAAAGWVSTRRRVRVACSSIGAFAYIISITLLDTPASIVWPPIASASFAAAVVVICGARGIWGPLAIAASAAFTAIGVNVPPIASLNISVSFLNGWIGPLVAVGLGLSFYVVLNIWDRSAIRFSSELTQAREDFAQALTESETANARRAVDRRIHETVLNTLNAIVVSDDREAIHNQCCADLAVIAEASDDSLTSVSSLIAVAGAKVPGITLTSHFESDPDITDATIRSVLGDAITELLRNVERHAAVPEAIITTQVLGHSLRVSVEDRGPGIPDTASGRFGLRGTLTQSVMAAGGSFHWSAAHPTGHRAVVELPLSIPPPSLSAPPSSDVLLDPPQVRAALLPTLWIGLIAVPVAAQDFVRPLEITASYLVLALACLALISRWRTPLRSTLAFVTICASLLPITLAAISQNGCQSAVAFHWIIFSAAGSLVLTTLAFTGLHRRIVAAGIPLAVSVGLAFTAPSTCRLDSVDAAFENAAWVSVILIVVTLLTVQFDKYRVAADIEWIEASRLRARTAAGDAAEGRWRQARATVDPLLRGICDGSLDPTADSSRQRAHLCQIRLRSLLELSLLRDEDTRCQWEDFLDDLGSATMETRFEVLDGSHVITHRSLVADLQRMVAASPRGQARVSLVAEGVLVRFRDVDFTPVEFGKWEILDTDGASTWLVESPRLSPVTED